MQGFVDIKIGLLRKFVEDVFTSLDVPEKDAKITADILITANRRGINSHGVARLERYVNYIKNNRMNPKTKITVIKETPVSLLISGGNGLGQVTAYKTMNMVIEKVKETGLCFATVRESNHYGIAGYYSMMALRENFIGISLTNSAPIVLPTFGKEAVIGTNPLSFAIPAERENPFVLDMSTSTVTRGKLEVYSRMDRPISEAWATDERGNPSRETAKILDNILKRKGGGLLPLGGGTEETGGHKGYGLSVLVDILSGLLSNGTFGPMIYSNKKRAGVCHFFGAINPEIFIPADEFMKNMDRFIKRLKATARVSGADNIYIHGEKEFANEKKHKKTVPIYCKVLENLKCIGRKVGIKLKP